MKLEDMKIYQIVMEIGNSVWFSVVDWKNLAKYSVDQLKKQMKLLYHYISQQITINLNKSL